MKRMSKKGSYNGGCSVFNVNKRPEGSRFNTGSKEFNAGWIQFAIPQYGKEKCTRDPPEWSGHQYAGCRGSH